MIRRIHIRAAHFALTRVVLSSLTRAVPSALTRAAIAVVGLAASASACPTCRDALNEADAGWARGFSLSIAFLLLSLCAILGTFGFAVWRAVRS